MEKKLEQRISELEREVAELKLGKNKRIEFTQAQPKIIINISHVSEIARKISLYLSQHLGGKSLQSGQ